MSETLAITPESKERLIQLALDGLADGAIPACAPRLCLGAGSDEIAIYGDGSFSCELSVGGWAANIPSFGRRIAGGDFGPSAGYFEFRALVEGIRAVIDIDHTNRSLHLHTDSEDVLRILRSLSSGANLSTRRDPSLGRLYTDARQLIGNRRIHWSHADTKSAHHQVCHQSARAARREQIQKMLAANTVPAISYEDRRRNELLRNRELLLRRLTRVETKLRACDARIAQRAATV